MVDAVIIGAGIGGLSAAAYLAKAGCKVMILEQDAHPGGTASVFKCKGFTFPTGPQSVTVPGYIKDSLSWLGVKESPGFIRDHFEVRRGDMDVMISVPLNALAKQLMDHFPGEDEGIIAIIKVLDEVITALDALAPLGLIEKGINSNTAREVVERWSSISALSLLDRHIKDQRLKDLLGSQGTSETEMSVVLLANMWRFMSKEGIWYIQGGIDKIPHLLAERVRTFGGEIHFGEQVGQILVNDGAAVGVKLITGELIKSPVVISDADYKQTLLELLPRNIISANKQEEISRMPLTSSAFTVFAGVKKDLVDLSPFKGHHLLVKLIEGELVPWKLKRPLPEDFLMDEIWLSWWSKHDANLAPPGYEALTIKVTAPFENFVQFSGGGRHMDIYYPMKEEMADALVSAASKVLPGLSDAVVVREVATPLTYKYRGHRSEGSVAGWSWRFGDYPDPWAQSLVISPVRGLLMVGLQSFTRLFYGGMGTALYSGKYAADMVLHEKRIN
ncbi:MAG: NAD(P)/FAD-dependent oxidoreductase [Candidatus Methanoperedens sp.]